MADAQRTLMAVHAHPDDEASSTGGILARYSAEGVRVVLVTCTDGSCGDGPGGVKPGQPGHDRAAVAELRSTELRASCDILGVDHLELLGYRDSGMMGWAENDEPGSFWSTPVEEGAARLAELIERYRPQVVVTYDPTGSYGHPDHIQAHRITMAAAASTGIPAKVYWPAIPRSRLAEWGRLLRAASVEIPDQPADGAGPEGTSGGLMGSPDEDIAAWIDTSAYTDRQFAALAAHASQEDNIFFLRLDPAVFARVMGQEAFLRAVDTTGAAVPEDDLFAGI
jgi:LmbE family N-acetylglucosaminyl deacetylase